jgi:glycosyltransferase involved in cell wall biosynthesis
MPLFTVILPTYSRNESGFLNNAIESVLSQEFKDFDLYVVDDGSSDGSSETIKGFSDKDSRVRHIRYDSNVGLPALTCSRAFVESDSPFIAWMFDDCIWYKHHLSSVASVIREREGDVIYAKCRMILPDGTESLLGSQFDKNLLKSRINFIPNGTAVVSRATYEQFGWFDPNILLARVCDFEFWDRIAERAKFLFIDDVHAQERGVSLPDSLGHSRTLNWGLVEKYVVFDRSEYLQPKKLHTWNPFWLPKELVLDHFEAESYLEVAANFISSRTGPIDEYLEKLLETPQLSELHYLFQTESRLFRWYQKRLQQNMFDLRTDCLKMQRYIDEKQEYINKQQEYINKQQEYINKQQENIHEMNEVVACLNLKISALEMRLTNRILNKTARVISKIKGMMH